MTSLFVVKIPVTETRHDDQRKPYTVYRVDVKTGSQEWSVFKRYSQFDAFRKQIESKFSHLSLPSFPPKSMSAMDDGVIQKRQEALQNYLSTLLKSLDICQSPELQQFLQRSEDTQQTDKKCIVM